MMDLFKRHRGRSQSTSSVTAQPLLQDADSDGVSSLGNGQVYLTRTKAGELVLGRRKSAKLLQDFGFDILGQSFGVPSRKDFERQARPLSIVSQSSGLITAPDTPRLGRGTQSFKHNNQAYAYEDTESPIIRRKPSSIRSSSTPAPTTMSQYGGQEASSLQQHTACKRNSSPLRSRAANHHIPLPPPPPPPPPPSAVYWHNYLTANTGVPSIYSTMNTNLPPIPMSYHGAPHQPIHPSSYSYAGATMLRNAPDWANPQHYTLPRYQNSSAIPQPPNIPMSILPRHPQFGQPQSAPIPYMQAMPTAHPSNMPPPPPPPPPPQRNWPKAYTTATSRRNVARQNTSYVRDVRKVINPASKIGIDSKGVSAGQTHNEAKYGGDMKRHLSKRIYHVHVCAGCGKKRSTRYHRAHPLRKGEIPALDYCYSCLKDATNTDYETSEGDVLDKKSRKDYNRAKKSFKSLSRLFSRRGAFSTCPPSLRSISSAEESNSRASSLESDLSVVSSIREVPISPIRCSHERTSNNTTQVAETLASSVDSSGARRGSLLISSKEDLGKAKGVNKIRTTSQTEFIPAKYRTRIPRLRPRASPVGFAPPLSASPRGSASISDRHQRPLSTFANSTTRVTSPSEPVGTAARSKDSTLAVPNEKCKPAKQTHIQPPSGGEANMNRSYPETANPVGTSTRAYNRNVETSPTECFGTSMPTASRTAFENNADEATDHPISGFRPSNRVSLDDTPHRVSSPENSARRTLDDSTPGVADKPKTSFNWTEPLTPTDLPYMGDSNSPHVVENSWSDYQTDLEREAEEMAERDLAFAMSYYSDSDSDCNTAAPNTEGAETERGADGTVSSKPIERIEFASEKEQEEKSTNLHPSTELSAAYFEPSNRLTADLLNHQKNHMHNQLDDGQDDDDYVEYPPSPIGSSLIGHTGHSMEDIVIHSTARDRPATITDGHHIRPFMRLPST
ncbi:hypothetical protein SAMD00023353_4600620 [Rosellinia necatrix]|uniref:Uncharacterized protein n=1 Tax=Rosellinia necatrix TaxID=77044 RepID=A0A1W2TPI8_ROSNE|nr:hypothetical protein SAMD00023353_4600620 [Rosellinia necatrix]